MKKPDPQQPNIPLVFGYQRSIIGQLYQFTLQTARTTEELERYWEVLDRDDIATDQPLGNQ
jgi:hypothetical protein